jgi:Fe-S-cluster containining protein
MLPSTPVAGHVSCLECARCCTYVAISIDPPRGVRAAFEILRLLDHEDVSVRRDEEGDWYVQFDTRCGQLADDRRCRIYEHRPHICRGYDEDSCEVNRPSHLRVYWTQAEFLADLRRDRPRLHRRLVDEGLADG